MVDLMSLLRDVLVCSLQVWMLNDFGKNMFPYRVEPLWKRIGVYFAAALCIFIANHMTSAGKIIRIHVENILYVSRAKRGCEITIVKEQEKETVRCREAFGELCEQLKDQGFAQAHYSYIVKLGKVEGLEKGVLRLKCGIELNVSRAKKEEFTEALFEYLRERNG